jgi:hypothetical protein
MPKTFAVIEDNKVVNTIVAETLEIAIQFTEKECVEIEEGVLAVPGWTYNDSTFEPPVTE